ncbi:MAG: ribonuclease R [Rhodobacterales bacterium]|nr:ribonuclease R [Rhodobacterales bacterium]
MSKLPTKKQIQDWIKDNPKKSSKREIAKAFGIKGSMRVELKKVLKELTLSGEIDKNKKSFKNPNQLSSVCILQMMASTSDGDLFARPVDWKGDEPEPIVLMVFRASDPALAYGDRVLSKVSVVHDEQYQYEGRIIRVLKKTPKNTLGIYKETSEGGRILPIEKSGREWSVKLSDALDAKDGELVEAEQIKGKRASGLYAARVINIVGDPSGPKAVSLIAIHQHGIPHQFPEDVLNESENSHFSADAKREDLTKIPFVTIDPSDARDHDDAVYSHPDKDPSNVGGHVLWVAIADVAHFVKPGSALDKEARKRGNSTYFADRVVPMLPDRLSGDLCSIHEGIERPCLAVCITIDKSGKKLKQTFHRANIKSVASLNYEEVQKSVEGTVNEKVKPHFENVIKPLYECYFCLKKSKDFRQPLDLDLPERKVELFKNGRVKAVVLKERFDSHRLIEEFMILANVAAAEELSKARSEFLYRVHEEPTPEKLNALREVAQSAGFNLAKGQVLQTSHLNDLLTKSKQSDLSELISMTTLRSMSQAYYSRENFGHFGLALKKYAHFTSPIRRYSDLITHRALISSLGLGCDGLKEMDSEKLEGTAKHISDTERRSMVAERDTTDRYLASYLSEKVGNEFEGKISGVAKFGFFVRLNESGAEGIVPVRTLGTDFYYYDDRTNTLRGSETGLIIGLGQRATVRLKEVDPIAGGIAFDALSIDGEKILNIQKKRSLRSIRRKVNRNKSGSLKRKKKAKRS